MAIGYAAGMQVAQIFVRDSLGIATGQQNTLANAASSGAYVWFDVKTAGLNPIAPTNLNIQGGDKIKSVIQFGGPKQGAFDLIGSSYDSALSDFITTATSNTSNSQVTVTSENPNRTFPRVLGLCLTQIFQQQDGTLKYLSRIFPSCYMRFRQGGMQFQGESDVTINVTPNFTSKAITGQTFDATAGTGLNLNLEQALTDNYVRITSNPFHIMSFRQDGTATTFNTTYKPISTTITLNATENEFFINATPTALSSLTLAGLATLAAAGSAGVGDLLMYATNFAQ